MKRFLLSLCLAAVTITSNAQNMIPLSVADSIQITRRFDITIAGDILICSVEYHYGRDRTCEDAKGHNKWVRMKEISIPGKQLVGFLMVQPRNEHDREQPILQMYFKSK